LFLSHRYRWRRFSQPPANQYRPCRDTGYSPLPISDDRGVRPKVYVSGVRLAFPTVLMKDRVLQPHATICVKCRYRACAELRCEFEGICWHLDEESWGKRISINFSEDDSNQQNTVANVLRNEIRFSSLQRPSVSKVRSTRSWLRQWVDENCSWIRLPVFWL
jgi:hypothetical protein